ncbi:hypothetical protein PoB_004239700 [Plakobranchus ocellatus]|uniref:Uncharacterized protein n=1 Tax=Plakobranchus ocellatus TaxID=259542 RepID=A0AAV4B8X2_9GAST|nr:hypothetical protein PoB_004239700 [Plakobranchus ocellatus]
MERETEQVGLGDGSGFTWGDGGCWFGKVQGFGSERHSLFTMCVDASSRLPLHFVPLLATSFHDAFHLHALFGGGELVAQWLVSPPRDLQGPFCRGFEPRHRHPGLTEGLKA